MPLQGENKKSPCGSFCAERALTHFSRLLNHDLMLVPGDGGQGETAQAAAAEGDQADH